MFKEIFSFEDSTVSQPAVDWSKPPIYDEYTEDGFLIVKKSQRTLVDFFEANNNVQGSNEEQKFQ
ncbi:hypothetical protein RHMOL_Rhmol09G0227000 [Rhododendron molle]|uniref:Uncharacterized protein n=1 Tax=Rhododendron molle TaxID=49168 RepID=A0ACC0MHQ3_RHOML|nr:hypothetical protein RHMOL_Rhmol09G0227000 [Rhododendron molle]